MGARRSSSPLNLSPGQASYVLERLISERRVSQRDLERYVNEMTREIGDLERRLQSLREATGGGAGTARRPGRPPGSGRAAVAAVAVAGAKRRRRRARITPEQLASRQLQGRYLGLIRQIPASKRNQFKKLAQEKGREAAIKEMVSALGK